MDDWLKRTAAAELADVPGAKVYDIKARDICINIIYGIHSSFQIGRWML